MNLPSSLSAMGCTDQRSAVVERQIQAEANDSLQRAGLVAAALGISNGVLIPALMWAGLAHDIALPGAFALGAGLYSLLIHGLAKRGRLLGLTVHFVFVPFVSLPTLFFLAAHWSLPGGAATYITGPFSYLYFFLIVMTGFLFQPRVSIVSGIVCGLGYLAAYALAEPTLARIVAPDPTLGQDLSSPAIYAIKALMMGFSGLVVGVLAVRTRRLILRTLDEQQARERVDRLFGQYVSDEVRDRLVRQTQELRGERVAVAVLFSDLRSYSTFSEGRAPELVVAQLNAYFDRMVGAIRSEGGMVDKFIGDAVMAVFGGVAAMDEPCQAALRAARGMRRALAELNREWTEHGEATFEHGIGIAYGDVVQGPIGSAERKEFTVIGDPVNVASRIEGITKTHGHAIIVTEEVVSRLDEAARKELVALGPVVVKGKRQPVEIHGVRE